MPSHICITYNQAELQSTRWQYIYLTNWKYTGKTRAGQVWRSEDKKAVKKLRGPEKSRRMIRYLGCMNYKERKNQWDCHSLKKTEVGHSKSDEIMDKVPTK